MKASKNQQDCELGMELGALMKQMMKNCRYFLSGHGISSAQKSLLKMIDGMDPHTEKDSYGEGEQIRQFEDKIASFLGKEAAVFMPSGTMAQQIALRLWADRSGRRQVIMHPTCHVS